MLVGGSNVKLGGLGFCDLYLIQHPFDGINIRIKLCN
jgi:hypothetical protein